MTELSHNPGPWEVRRGGPIPCPTVRNEDGMIIAAVHHREGQSAEANARLIAAAPELLAALKAAVLVAIEAAREWDASPEGMKAGKLLLALAGNISKYRSDIDRIHDAIAKATGHQS